MIGTHARKRHASNPSRKEHIYSVDAYTNNDHTYWPPLPIELIHVSKTCQSSDAALTEARRQTKWSAVSGVLFSQTICWV
jgi:hypothetical protein